MKYILKNYNLSSIKGKFIAIYLLNLTDTIFTYILLGTGLFLEANTVMNKVIDSKLTTISIKTILPLIILYVVFKRMREATEKQLKSANILINICMTLYIFINISHILWISVYFLIKA